LLTTIIDMHTAEFYQDEEDDENERAKRPRAPMNSVETLVLEASSELETPPSVYIRTT
jgi:hypothetical protein